MQIALLVIVFIISGIIQGTCGFGAGLLAMAVMPFIIDYKIALPVMFLSSVALNLQILSQTYRHIRWRSLLMPLIFSLAGRILGQLVFHRLQSDYLQIVLGIIILFTAVFQLLWQNKIKIKEKISTAGIFGLTSGIIGGISGTGGPPLVVYFLNLQVDKYEYIASLQTLLLSGTLFSIILSSSAGYFTRDVFVYGIFAVCSIVTGSFLGLKLFKKLNRTRLTLVINIFLIVTGISLLLKVLIK